METKTGTCRICSYSGTIPEELKSILDCDEETGCAIAVMMEELADVTVTGDSRSKQVCVDCAQKVAIGYAIRRDIRRVEHASNLVEMLQMGTDDDGEASTEEGIVVGTEIKLEDLLEEDNEEFQYEFLDEEYLSEGGTVSELTEDSKTGIESGNNAKHTNIERTFPKTAFVMPKPEVVLRKVDHPTHLVVEVKGDRCCGCSFVGTSRRELLQHSDSEHAIEIAGSGNYCPICFYKFHSEGALTRHIDGSRSRAIYVCKTCERYFNSSKQLDVHFRLRQCEGSGGTDCNTVDDGKDSLRTVEEDTLVDDDQGTIFCSDSEWEFTVEEQEMDVDNEFEPPPSVGRNNRRSNNSEQLQHIEDYIKSPDGVVLEEIDEKRVAKRVGFATFEILKLNGERCCGCSFTCDSRDQLFVHARELHNKSNEDKLGECLCVCPICRQNFEDQKELSQHINCNTTKLLFVCTICNETFAGTKSLRYHQEHSTKHCILVNNDSKAVKKPLVELKDGNVTDAIEKEFQQPGRNRNYSRLNNRSITKHRYLKMPNERFIKQTYHHQNHEVLTVCGERCCGCGEFFDTFTEVLNHGLKMHLAENAESIGEFQCEICFARFEWSRGLFMHMTSKRSVTTMYRCKICNLLFLKQKSIEKHLLQAPNHLTPPIIEEAPESEPCYDQKQVNTKPDQPSSHKFHCCLAKCTQEFVSEELLLSHCLDQHGGKRRENEAERTNDENVCPGCLKSFENPTCLVWHRFNRFTKQYICRFCGQVFNSWSRYREHEDVVHLGKIHEYPCDKCQKVFRTPQRLKIHQETHSEARTEICNECGASFRNRGVLKRHRRTVHASEKPFACPHCPKMLPTQEQLKAHSRVHTGVKPYGCRFCERSFSHFTDRKRHEMASHTGERPYQCPHCPAAYIRNRELTVHLQKHEEEGTAGLVGTE
nr:zinc finger protein 836-like [Aedes albopictus]